jgi:UDP-glucuronate 4-epimerase
VKRRNIADSCKTPDFRLIEGDIRDRAYVDRATQDGVDVVVHLAARAGVRPSIENPGLYQDVNIRGTCELLEAARRHGVTRFVFTSSSSVYGNNDKVPFNESDNVDCPISPYAATKKAGELLCYTYHHLFNINITCLRLFTVYGPRQRPDLAIHKFARLMAADQPIPVFGDGTAQRDYTYIDDIVAGFEAAIERCSGFRIYNLGNHRPVSLNDLIAALENAMGTKAVIDRLPLQAGDVRRTCADIGRARAELDWAPRTALDEGLARFVEWFRIAGV